MNTTCEIIYSALRYVHTQFLLQPNQIGVHQCFSVQGLVCDKFLLEVTVQIVIGIVEMSNTIVFSSTVDPY